MTKDQQVGPSI
jgi:hypothetical protein